MKHRHGFGLLEVILGACLLSIGIFFATQMVLWGRIKLKETENKSFALNQAALKLEQYMAQSYSHLGTAGIPEASDTDAFTLDFGANGLLMRQSGDMGDFHWNSSITRITEVGQPASWRKIPYKHIEVIVAYVDEDLKGTVQQRQIRLVNFQPYPFIHTAKREFPMDAAVTVPGPNSALALDVNNPDAGHFQPIEMSDESLFRVHVNFETAKDVMILYNIDILVTNPTGIKADHTLYTACFVDGAAAPEPVVTRNPIMTQPSINNIVVLTEAKSLMPVSTGHNIDIRWFKETTSGTVTFKGGNIIIFAAEKL